MEKEFVTYEIALKLKELCFNKTCLGSFKNERLETINANIHYCDNLNRILAPLWQQVIEWFSINHGIFLEIRFADKALTVYEFCVYKTFEELVQNTVERISLGDDRKVYPTYYEAREQAILKAIELCKKEK